MLKKKMSSILTNPENKLLNNNFYSQNWIRKLGPKTVKERVFTIDSYSELQRFSSKKNYFLGSSINHQKKILTNQYNKSFKLATILGTKNTENTKFLENYKNRVNCLKKDEKQANFVTITHVIKGGAQGLASGIVGFVPKSQYYQSLKGVLKQKTTTLNSIMTLKKLSKIVTLKVPLKEANVSIYPTESLNKFTKNSHIKKHYAKNNIVFVDKMKESRNYENKKKIRKLKSELLPKREKKFHNRKN